MHYYSHHIGDFLKATSSLSDADKMSYLKLMWTYYDTERPLPNDPDMLAFQIGATREKVLLILQSYFYLENDFWRHTRCDEELSKVYAKSEVARNKAMKRWKDAAAMQQHQEHVDLHNALGMPQDSQSNATVMLQHTSSNAAESKNDATHKPINPIKNKKQKPPEGVSDSLWDDFLQVRKAKKLPMTDTALEAIKREAVKAGLTLQQAITICCERGWGGFNADWLKNDSYAKPAVKAGMPDWAPKRATSS